MSDLRIIRGASNSRFGGIHWYEWQPKDEVVVGPRAPDLVLLHPLPQDGGFFSVIAPYLAAGRTVIAPDYPGYGKSDPLPGPPSIEDWAAAMLDTLEARSTDGPADLFGFHTGCLVAAEMSLRGPDLVRRIVMIDVPFFDDAGRADLLAREWAVGGFVAAFDYAALERFPLVEHECLVIATASDLLEPTAAAAQALSSARFEELPDVTEPPLETGAVEISGLTLDFLDSEDGA